MIITIYCNCYNLLTITTFTAMSSNVGQVEAATSCSNCDWDNQLLVENVMKMSTMMVIAVLVILIVISI